MSAATKVLRASSLGSSTSTTRLAWRATAASNRLRAARPLPKPWSRGWASNQARSFSVASSSQA